MGNQKQKKKKKKGNYDEGFGRERKGTGNVVMTPSSFVPKVEEESKPQRKETSSETGKLK